MWGPFTLYSQEMDQAYYTAVSAHTSTHLSEHFRKVIDVSRSICLCVVSLQLQMVLRDIWRADQKPVQRPFLRPVRLIYHLSNNKYKHTFTTETYSMF